MYTSPPSKLLGEAKSFSSLKFFFDTLTFTVRRGGECTNGHKTHTIKHTSKFSLLKSTTYPHEPSENHTQITHNRPQTVPTVHAQPAHNRPHPATYHTQTTHNHTHKKPWTNGHKHVRMATNHTQPHTKHTQINHNFTINPPINQTITILNLTSSFTIQP